VASYFIKIELDILLESNNVGGNDPLQYCIAP